MQQLKDINPGQIFTIEETPSYPKLRTSTGYIDIRDEITKTCDSLPWELRIMDTHEVLAQLRCTQEDLQQFINDFKK